MVQPTRLCRQNPPSAPDRRKPFAPKIRISLYSTASKPPTVCTIIWASSWDEAERNVHTFSSCSWWPWVGDEHSTCGRSTSHSCISWPRERAMDRTRLHEDATRGAVSTPSGYCSRIMFGRLRAASLRKSNVVDPAGFPPCLESWSSHCRLYRWAPRQAWWFCPWGSSRKSASSRSPSTMVRSFSFTSLF